MTAITATVTAITKMMKGRMEAVPLGAIVGQPTFNSVQHLAKKLATFASHFATTKWGGKHSFLPLALGEAKIRLTARDNYLNCERVSKPKIFNPKIEENSKVRKLLQLQEGHKV